MKSLPVHLPHMTNMNLKQTTKIKNLNMNTEATITISLIEDTNYLAHLNRVFLQKYPNAKIIHDQVMKEDDVYRHRVTIVSTSMKTYLYVADLYSKEKRVELTPIEEHPSTREELQTLTRHLNTKLILLKQQFDRMKVDWDAIDKVFG